MQWYVEIDILFSTGGNINGYDKTKRKRALMLTTVHTLFVAGFEIFMVYTNYRPGMNFFDLASYVNSNR